MTDVVMPQMGESIVEGTLTKWLKKTGDKVERDEPLFEISTDKVDTEIPSPVAGTLGDVLVQEGQTVQVNAIVARINDGGAGGADGGASGAVAAAPAAKAAEPAPAPQQAAPPPPPPAAPPAAKPAPAPPSPAAEEVKETAGLLSPLVRKMARENNIDLSKVAGTGAGGRITKEDIETYLQRPAAAAAPAPTPAGPAVPIGQAQPTAKSRIEPMSNMRIKIAEHMVMSKRISAHVTTVHRVDMTRVAKMRAKHKEDFAARYGMSLTFLPFVARAAVEALRAFPVVNASIDGTNIIYHNEINLGIAVALDNGLIVPVIRNADEKTVLGLQRAIVDLASRARAKQLKPDEIQAGTFSITNFGSFGSIFATPIINQPQVAILGVGAVEKVPVVVDDAIAIRSQCFLALTFDHRLIDGALGDQFTGKVKSILENWSEEVL
jgi:pyruvate dehydrogenase E2 component (dihydrolipoamide acetyltransferase)